jgi:hypothetical protein
MVEYLIDLNDTFGALANDTRRAIVGRLLAPIEGGTHTPIRIQGEAGGMYGLLGPLTPLMVRRSVQSDLGRMKRALERDAK